jgi:large subunit ribosomal protein L23
MHKTQVLLRPVVTEKTDLMTDKLNQVVFAVDTRANKRAIREAVEHVFDVKVTDVRTMLMPGKGRRWGRHITKTPRWKKAIVTLAPGDTIDFAE